MVRVGKFKFCFFVLIFFFTYSLAADPVDHFFTNLAHEAKQRTSLNIHYDPAYVQMTYPGGDVPSDTGVCTDLVIRSYRQLGIDLQKEVHEDMQKAFHLYPKIWGLKSTDKNIDHRRVPNLRVFFARHGKTLSLSENPQDYFPGDLVTYDLDNRVPHIGIVSQNKSLDGKRPLLIHNIGEGPKEEDVLFSWKMTGHFRYKK